MRAALAQTVAFAGHAGMLHRPPQTLDNGVVVVMCAPVGREARWAYRPFWLLAERLAALGFSVLRYDHRGAGDSLDLEPGEDHWMVWRRGLGEAVAFARSCASARQVVVCGLRLGASLAAASARELQADALVLLAPVASGRAWIRELQMTAGIFRAKAAPEVRDEVIADAVTLSPATVAELQAFDLKSCGPLGVPTLVAAPSGAARLAASLGPGVEAAPFERYEALMRDAHVNAIPEALFARVTSWLQALPRPPAEPAPAVPLPPAELATARWVERPVTFGSGLRGVLCLPTGGRRSQGVVFGNSGGDPRAGIGGFAARACRALASRGVPALRFDFVGLGESPAADWPSQVYCFDGGAQAPHGAPAAWRSHVYESSREPDFAAARALMQGHGCETVMLAGVCSGAYQAVRTAVEGEGYAGVLAINPARWIWRRGEPLDVAHEKTQHTGRLDLHTLVSPSAWRKVLLGHIRLDDIVDVAARRIGRLFGLEDPGPQGRELRAELARYADRGGVLHVLVGREDAAVDELERYFAANGRWLAQLPRAAVTIAPGLDHGLFLPESQAVAMAALLRFVDAARSRPNRVWAARRRRRRSVLPTLGASRLTSG